MLHADGSLKYRFEYADDRTPVAMTAGGQTYYLMYDQVGSLRAVTDAGGAIVKTVTYDSFGNVLEDSNPALDVPFGFAGGLHDADTGLVRFGYRDYAPEVGRWTAKDPIGFGGGDSDLYGYCGGDPINLTDFTGLYSDSATLSHPSHQVGSSGGGGGAISGAILGGLLGWWASPDTSEDVPPKKTDEIPCPRLSPPSSPDCAAIRDFCIDECYPILNRPIKPSAFDRNTWDFLKCVNDCLQEHDCL